MSTTITPAPTSLRPSPRISPRPAPIRVMQVTHDLGVGGLEQVIVTLCRTLDRRYFEPSVLCLRKIGEFGAQLAGYDVPIFQIPPSAGPNYLAFRSVAETLRAQRIEVVHTHNTWAFIDGGLGAIAARVPTLVHTDHARSFPDRLRYRVAEHVLSHFAHRVVGVSDHTVENLRRHEWIARRKLCTIINGIELGAHAAAADDSAIRRELGLEPGAPTIGVTARLTEQKGLTYLVQAMPALVARHPRLTLLIAGEGPLLEALRAEAVSLGVAGHVRFLGLRMDVPALLRIIDVFVLPSIWEGLPIAILEAMAAGRPIVATDVGGVATAVGDGRNGLLVPPQRPDRLAAAVSELLDDPDRRARFGVASRRITEERFSAEAMTRQYEDVYMAGARRRRQM